MSRGVRVHCLAAAMLLASLASAGLPPPAAGADAVRLGVDVIYASDEGQQIDPSLAHVERQLRTFRYSSFHRLGTHQLVRLVGQQGTISLPGGRTLLLAPQGISGGSVVLLLSIQGGGRAPFNTELKLANGGTILVGGPGHEAGVLILAVTATSP